MRKIKRFLAVLLMLSMLLPILPISALVSWAESIGRATDAMAAIEGDERLSACKQGETQRYADDGYIGIPYEVSVYYDDAMHGKARAGCSVHRLTART